MTIVLIAVFKTLRGAHIAIRTGEAFRLKRIRLVFVRQQAFVFYWPS